MASNSTLTPMVMGRPKKRKKGSAAEKPPPDVTPKDGAFDRNFTKDGKPRLNATSGAMGQRR